MNYYVAVLMDYSIVLPVVAGCIRYRTLFRYYLPFLLVNLAALTSETVSLIINHYHYSNAVVSNIYTLAECLLWLWQFKRWQGFARKPRVFVVLTVVLCGFWLTEHILFWNIVTFRSVFAVIYSFCIVFLSINQVNELIFTERQHLLRNAKFLICTGLIIFFTYNIMVDSFYLFRLDASDSFMVNVYDILVFVNLFVNVLFAIACMRVAKREPLRVNGGSVMGGVMG